LLQTLIENGWFHQQGLTPVESAKQAPAAEAIRLISLKNATF